LESNDSLDNNFIEGYISNRRLINRLEIAARIHQYQNIFNEKKIKMNYIFGGLNYSTSKYITSKGLFKFGQIEDIKLGTQVGGGIKLINTAFGANINGFGWELNIKHSYNKNQDFIFQNYNFDYSYLKDYSNNTLDFKIDYLHLYSENFKFINRITFKKMHTYKSGYAYSLGENKGLRGYKSISFEGNKYLLMNTELQYIFKKEFFKILIPGINIFYDAGRTYNQGEQIKLNKIYHDAGISFRMIIHRSSSFQELNFAISKPFKNEHSAYFSFQTNLDF